jgi:hypothetical protein
MGIEGVQSLRVARQCRARGAKNDPGALVILCAFSVGRCVPKDMDVERWMLKEREGRFGTSLSLKCDWPQRPEWS